MMAQMTYENAVSKYGIVDPFTKIWKDQAQHMELLHLPDDLVFPNWKTTGVTSIVKRLYCNKDATHAFLEALFNVRDRGLSKELKTFDGLFNIRFVRGSIKELSAHAYGLAIDINASENMLGCNPALSSAFVRCWKDAGFSWGGDFSRKDGMHFSWAWE